MLDKNIVLMTDDDDDEFSYDELSDMLGQTR